SGVDAVTTLDAADALSRQLAETIRWADCMDAAAEAGITVALELGPGAALSKMLQGRHGQIACRSVAEFRSLDGIIGWLERQQ
ncbi:MAG: malonyl CoA-ACP transacylase, partial [Massilia sp.]